MCILHSSHLGFREFYQNIFFFYKTKKIKHSLSYGSFFYEVKGNLINNLQQTQVYNQKLTTGNARNYQLLFEGTDQIAPVARSRFKDFNTAFLN